MPFILKMGKRREESLSPSPSLPMVVSNSNQWVVRVASPSSVSLPPLDLTPDICRIAKLMFTCDYFFQVKSMFFWFLSSKTRIPNNIFTNPTILLPQMTPEIEKKMLYLFQLLFFWSNSLWEHVKKQIFEDSSGPLGLFRGFMRFLVKSR
jgi:hypothetical protein